jgi:hypothetical protein
VQADRVPDSSEKALIDEVQRRLTRKYAHLAEDLISSTVQQVHSRFEHSKVRDFVPLLVERRASDQLSRHSELVPASS